MKDGDVCPRCKWAIVELVARWTDREGRRVLHFKCRNCSFNKYDTR